MAEALFEEVGTMQGGVSLGDPGQLRGLVGGEGVGVLPEGVASSGDPEGGAAGASGPSFADGAPGVIPAGAADVVEGFLGPLHNVERVGAVDRRRAAGHHNLGDPARRVAGNMGN